MDKPKYVDFQKMPVQDCFTLENQDEVMEVESEEDIYDFYDIMLNDFDQYIILTSPDAINGIRFVQSRQINDKNGEVEVEIAVETKNAVNLYYKIFNEENGIDVFLDFYCGRFVPNMKEYKAVEFI